MILLNSGSLRVKVRSHILYFWYILHVINYNYVELKYNSIFARKPKKPGRTFLITTELDRILDMRYVFGISGQIFAIAPPILSVPSSFSGFSAVPEHSNSSRDTFSQSMSRHAVSRVQIESSSPVPPRIIPF